MTWPSLRTNRVVDTPALAVCGATGLPTSAPSEFSDGNSSSGAMAPCDGPVRRPRAMAPCDGRAGLIAAVRAAQPEPSALSGLLLVDLNVELDVVVLHRRDGQRQAD